MKRFGILQAAVCALFAAAAAGMVRVVDAQASRGALARGTFAITNVNVVPMTSDTVLRGATVLVRDGRIAAVGPWRNIGLAAGVRRIDGQGKYLIPGLVDMHTHLLSDGEVADSVAPYELGVMVANGLTTVRLMMGTPEQLRLRSDVAAGRLLGPQLWLASPEFAGRSYGGSFSGHAVSTPAEARAAVREAAAAGYDLVKLTLFISRPVYDAIVEEAARSGIKVTGHVDPQVGVPRALEARQQMEHLDNYLEQVLADTAPMRTSVSDRGIFQPRYWESLDYVDDRKVAEIAGATARAKVFITPTLTVFKRAFALKDTEEEIRSRPDWELTPPRVRDLYMGARERYWANAASEPRRRRWVKVRDDLVKAIADSGGKILAGSDSPEWLFTYGFTLHRELESLVATGLTPYQALAAATRNPAEYLGAASQWGTIERGKRADLVLLSANPLDDIRHTTRIEGVSLGGRWLERPELDRMVRAAADRLR